MEAMVLFIILIIWVLLVLLLSHMFGLIAYYIIEDFIDYNWNWEGSKVTRFILLEFCAFTWPLVFVIWLLSWLIRKTYWLTYALIEEYWEITRYGTQRPS